MTILSFCLHRALAFACLEHALICLRLDHIRAPTAQQGHDHGCVASDAVSHCACTDRSSSASNMDVHFCYVHLLYALSLNTAIVHYNAVHYTATARHTKLSPHVVPHAMPVVDAASISADHRAIQCHNHPCYSG
eukprot:4816-Heterococcus_DN1.PRE.5